MVKGFKVKDNWDHSNSNMRCATCLWSHRKTDGTLRCRANAPSVKGWPVMFDDDWCGEHKIDGDKLKTIFGEEAKDPRDPVIYKDPEEMKYPGV